MRIAYSPTPALPGPSLGLREGVIKKTLRQALRFLNNTGWGRGRFTALHMENKAIIHSVLRTHNCKPTFAPPCIS